MEQQQSATVKELVEVKRNREQEIAQNKNLQEKLAVLAQHLDDEALRQNGDCTLSVAFDCPQRQQQYTQAVKSLLQPIVDKYVLEVEILQRPKHCNFLVYVTFSSTARLVNFDNSAFTAFKQGCSTGNAAVLVIRRNQSDPANGEKILSTKSAIVSGLRLGTPAASSHLLQLSAHGSANQVPELLSNSEVNSQNQMLLSQLLQEVLQLTERQATTSIVQRILGFRPRFF